MSVTKEPFGSAEKYTITGSGALSASILTYGATIQSLTFRGVDVALGYSDLNDYATLDGYLGATVGRYANRIAGGRFTLNGVEYDVGCNEQGRGHLHGGFTGVSRRVWAAEVLDDNALRLSITLPAGEDGYPGTMQLSVTFTVDGDTLRLAYHAVSDADTVFNPTNHCYFNLNGQDGAPVTNHLMQIAASAYTPTDDTQIPTGELRPVAGTAFDFRTPKPIGQDIKAPDPQLRLPGGYDHNFVLDGAPGTLRFAARVSSPDTGFAMDCFTDLPGLQVYTACGLNNPRGKAGPLGQYQGFCFETQFFPDSPNKPDFPSATLPANTPFETVTEYRFSK